MLYNGCSWCYLPISSLTVAVVCRATRKRRSRCSVIPWTSVTPCGMEHRPSGITPTTSTVVRAPQSRSLWRADRPRLLPLCSCSPGSSSVCARWADGPRSGWLTVRDKTAAVFIVCAQSALLLWPRLPSPHAKMVSSISPVRAVGDRSLAPRGQSFSVSEGVKNIERWLTTDSQRITKLLMKVGQLRYNRHPLCLDYVCDV
jgi:hypothetical protein